MHFNKIDIEGFRGLKRLELEDCKTINLIVGKNNSCKTSILEAIFLLTGIYTPHSAYNQKGTSNYSNISKINISPFPSPIPGWVMDACNHIRDFFIKKTDDLNLVFHNLDFSNPLNIQGEMKDKRYRKLQIQPEYPQEQNSDVNKFGGSQTNTSVDYLNLTFTRKESEAEEKDFTCRIKVVEQDKKPSEEQGRNPFENYKKMGNLVYIPSKIELSKNHIAKLDDIIKNTEIKEIIHVLQSVDNNICNISFDKNGDIDINVGIGKLIPLNLIGDGVKRLLCLILALYDARGGILLIDEVETSLHFSALEPLWKSMYELANELKVQIFMTTHSIDTLKSLAKVGATLGENFHEVIRSYTICKNNRGDLKAFKYKFEELNFSLEHNIEMR